MTNGKMARFSAASYIHIYTVHLCICITSCATSYTSNRRTQYCELKNKCQHAKNHSEQEKLLQKKCIQLQSNRSRRTITGGGIMQKLVMRWIYIISVESKREATPNRTECDNSKNNSTVLADYLLNCRRVPNRDRLWFQLSPRVKQAWIWNSNELIHSYRSCYEIAWIESM